MNMMNMMNRKIMKIMKNKLLNIKTCLIKNKKNLCSWLKARENQTTTKKQTNNLSNQYNYFYN